MVAFDPSDMQTKVTRQISSLSKQDFYATSIALPDSTTTYRHPGTIRFLYVKNESAPIWSWREKWKPEADSLFSFLESAQLFGLFPEDYHVEKIREIRAKFFADSSGKTDRRNVMLWTVADFLLTDGFIQLIKDIKLGRLPQDSVSLRQDSLLGDEYYLNLLQSLPATGLSALVASIEPVHPGYHLLKQGIKKFIDSAEYKTYTIIPYPVKDPAGFREALQKRLYEGGFIAADKPSVDSVQLAAAVKLFQQKKGLVADGRAGEATVRMLNVNDREKFIRIAISLDKYKMLPAKMPEKYIWVNTSSNLLDLIEKNKVRFTSRVICGKAKTPTPVLNGMISELITYPRWVPPPSIVTREILPAVKRNPGYLARKGFHLVDGKGKTIDPYSVNWSKYRNSIPYLVVQRSGDGNALGIMKFVFANKYSVYLHDTNQRYLFSNTMRSLSHGCVRVQDWEKLMLYILRNDSASAGSRVQTTKIDSVRSWLKDKQKKSIAIQNKIPLFIRYFTCEGENGKIVFYDDVYAEDKLLREKYFASK